MLISRRNMMKNCALAGAAVTATVATTASAADDETGITNEQLEQLITSLGLKPNQNEQRFDFGFKAALNEEEWELSMSAVLSQDGNTVWVMAWLDELPKSSAEVPRTALLRLLAANDQMGNGKFFAYIPANRKFVMQVSIPNQDMTSAKLQEVMKDLGNAVVETYPQWHTANWAQAETAAAANPAAAGAATGGQAASTAPAVAR